MNLEADTIIFHLSQAADSLIYIAYGMELQNGSRDCEEANAVHYIANSIGKDVSRLREIFENKNKTKD